MPCKDSSALITIHLNPQDRLRQFEFSKITCQKEIGDYTPYNRLCQGKTVEEILEIDFSQAVESSGATHSEDQFLLYLQWEALRAALAQYSGNNEGVDTERYLLESISHDDDGVEIKQIIRPPKEMPKIVSCAVRTET